ncbi:MAG: site-specific integrase [Eubacterium sp.]|nr:site-specific integrase [Eubacterium sp.]
MSRKGENIYKRKDGRWEGRFIKRRAKNNKAVYGYVYDKSYSAVKEKLLKEKSGYTNSTCFGNQSETDISFQDITKLWLVNKSNLIKPSTFNRYNNLLNNNILPFIGKKNMSDISTDAIQEYIRFLSTGGRIDKKGGLSAKTISDIICVIKSVLNYSESLGYRHNCALKYIGFRTEKREMRVLNRNEQQQLTQYLINDIDKTKAGILLSLYTGIRIGELCALKANDFDFHNKKLIVRQTLQRLQKNKCDDSKTYISITDPKSTKSAREIPLPDFLCKIFLAMGLRSNEYILSGTVTPIEPRTMENRYNRIMKDLGITGATFHTLRHTFATRSVEVGFDVKSLSEILGHSGVNITLNRYVHSSFELKSENMKKLEILL